MKFGKYRFFKHLRPPRKWQFMRIHLTRLANSFRSCPRQAEAGASEDKDWEVSAKSNPLSNVLFRLGRGVSQVPPRADNDEDLMNPAILLGDLASQNLASLNTFLVIQRCDVEV